MGVLEFERFCKALQYKKEYLKVYSEAIVLPDISQVYDHFFSIA
ncbi:MAG: hypothetical protein ACJAWW_002382 [Sulfurimonas sp.]|jgi:hypothetical protein